MRAIFNPPQLRSSPIQFLNLSPPPHLKILPTNLRMSDPSQTGEIAKITSTGNKDNMADKTVDTKPPPPEKPLAGDCCGSGCVRCVWDNYYDELEEYNKLYADNK